MPGFYQLKIVTPQGSVFSGNIRHAQIPVENGYVGVLAQHAPYVTSSAGGVFTVDDDQGKRKSFKVGPGFFTVSKNQATFLTDSFDDSLK